MYFYTQLLDSVPVKTPRPLAVWTDGSDGTDGSAPAMKCFALMMEDMSIEHDVRSLVRAAIPTACMLTPRWMQVFDATCLDPARTMTSEQVRLKTSPPPCLRTPSTRSMLTPPGPGLQIRAANKQQLLIHDKFWNSPLINCHPMTNPSKGVFYTG